MPINYTPEPDVIDESRGPWMQLVNGQPFYPFAPNFEVVTIEVIAHALAHQCRYGGHSKRFYSVAEHCVKLARYVEETYTAGTPKIFTEHSYRSMIREALLHDMAEAVLVDMPRPIKHSLPDYQALEDTIYRGLAKQFKVPERTGDVIKDLDRRICGDEYRQILNPCIEPWGMDIAPLGVTIHGWEPHVARAIFLTVWESCKP